MRELTYEPFKLMKTKVISEQCSIILTTLRTWAHSKPLVVRALEHATYFSLNDLEVVSELRDPGLSYLDALKLIGGNKIKVTEFSMLVGVPVKTLQSWWKGTIEQRNRLISIMLGQMALLFIAKHGKLMANWEASDNEILLSSKVSPIESIKLEIKKTAFDIWSENIFN